MGAKKLKLFICSYLLEPRLVVIFSGLHSNPTAMINGIYTVLPYSTIEKFYDTTLHEGVLLKILA